MATIRKEKKQHTVKIWRLWLMAIFLLVPPSTNRHMGPTKFCICKYAIASCRATSNQRIYCCFCRHQWSSLWTCAVANFVPLWWSASVHRHQPDTRAQLKELSGGGPRHSSALAAARQHQNHQSLGQQQIARNLVTVPHCCRKTPRAAREVGVYVLRVELS